MLPNHQYLNIILWCRLEDEKDFALAQVSWNKIELIDYMMLLWLLAVH